jgi:hypothetical protein
MKHGKVIDMVSEQKQRRLGPIRFGRPTTSHSVKKSIGKQKALFNKPEKSKKLFFISEFNLEQSTLTRW